MPNYNPFGCRTCFRVFSDQSDKRNFEDSHRFCRAQGINGSLLVLDNMNQISLLATYLKLNNIDEKVWIGMRYIDKSGSAVLVDINDNVVDLDIQFEEETLAATAGLCVSIVSRGGDNVSFMREQCNEMNNFICTISSIG